MKLCEFSLIRYAARLMTPEELQAAQKLADAADRGDKAAYAAVKHMVYEVLWERAAQAK